MVRGVGHGSDEGADRLVKHDMVYFKQQQTASPAPAPSAGWRPSQCTDAFEQFDLIQCCLRVVAGALDNLHRHEPFVPAEVTGRGQGHVGGAT